MCDKGGQDNEDLARGSMAMHPDGRDVDDLFTDRNVRI